MTLSTGKHTPTPWVRAQAKREWTVEANFRCGSFSASQICGKGRKDPVCLVVQADPRGYGSGDAELDANAALIVRAVNAHEALVGKLREAMRAIDRLIDASDSYSPAAQRSFEAHKVALSAADLLASLE